VTRTLEGTTAVVTGAGRGLGRAFSLGLARHGARIAVADLSGANAEAVAADVREQGGEACAFEVDVADDESVSGLVEAVGRALGAATVLVNNAAVFASLSLAPSSEISPSEWDQVMAVNARGVFLCCRAFAPAMRDGGYGKVVNVSSSQFWVARAGYPHYVASKGAVIALTRALATELGPDGIRVNSVAPGATVTEVPRPGVNEEVLQSIAEATPLGRHATPEDVVGPVVFFSSPASDFVTGQTLIVDGGASYA
jgi:3-oxoacyl-[acyl-carrier protein] reductase